MNENKLRTSEEIATRAIILLAIVDSGHGADRNNITKWLKKEKLWKNVSPKEKRFIGSKKPSKQQTINATWRVEALEVFLWSLGLVPSLTPSTKFSEVKKIKSLIPVYLNETKLFINTSELVSEDMINDNLEIIYEQHWKVRDATINNKPVPENLNGGVIQEKHHAFNWITGYENQSWDNVSTDT